jgi:hypothetical protein
MSFKTPAEVERIRLKQAVINHQRDINRLRDSVGVALMNTPGADGAVRVALRSRSLYPLVDYDADVVQVIEAELAIAGWRTTTQTRAGVDYLIIWPGRGVDDE